MSAGLLPHEYGVPRHRAEISVKDRLLNRAQFLGALASRRRVPFSAPNWPAGHRRSNPRLMTSTAKQGMWAFCQESCSETSTVDLSCQ